MTRLPLWVWPRWSSRKMVRGENPVPTFRFLALAAQLAGVSPVIPFANVPGINLDNQGERPQVLPWPNGRITPPRLAGVCDRAMSRWRISMARWPWRWVSRCRKEGLGDRPVSRWASWAAQCVGAADTHEGGDLLHPGGSREPEAGDPAPGRRDANSSGNRAPAVSPFEVERAKDGVESARTALWLRPARVPGRRGTGKVAQRPEVWAVARKIGSISFRAWAFQEFFQVAEGEVGSLKQGWLRLAWAVCAQAMRVWFGMSGGLTVSGYHIYDT